MQPVISSTLATIAAERQVRLLFACESGSRAWGFASPDSDYDVRFMFVQPIDRYLSIQAPPETIDRMVASDNLDFSGWDLRKTLGLLYKSNASIFEWLQSPILYEEAETFRPQLWDLALTYFQPVRMIHHYLGVMRSAYQHGAGDGHIRLKKYFYVLRPLLAARWIVDCQEVPPMAFSQLRTQSLPADIDSIISDLLAQKQQADEDATIELVPQLESFIALERARIEDVTTQLPRTRAAREPLDLFFREWIGA